jgi:cytochrome c oxidase subunit 2
MWNFPLIPDQASSNSWKVDALFLFELGFLVFFTGLIVALILGFMVRYRHSARADRSKPPRLIVWLEILWISVPFTFAMGMFAGGVIVYFEQYSPPGDASDLYVVGKQWMWKLQHPEGKQEINELHLPMGKPVRLLMTSEDVIHSFFVPAFRTKQDVLPGRYTELWFNPTKVGTFHLFCAEYCGTNHSRMVGSIKVMTPEDYEDWLSSGVGSQSMAKQGEALFVRYHCMGCHGASQTVRAPRLEGLFGSQVPIQEGSEIRFVTADTRYIRDSILLPKSQVAAGYEPVMPSFQGQIREEELLKIIEYIKSLGAGEEIR